MIAMEECFRVLKKIAHKKYCFIHDLILGPVFYKPQCSGGGQVVIMVSL